MGVEQAARTLGVSKRAVRNMAAGGKLEVKREGAAARLLVSVASLEDALLERRARATHGPWSGRGLRDAGGVG